MTGERQALPRLLLIADGFAAGRGIWPAHLVQLRAFAAAAAGVEWVQLRDHAAPPEGFDREARRFVGDVGRARPDTLFTVNTHLGTARALGAGLHVGTRGPSVAEARRADARILLSAAAHAVPEACAAVAAGADAVLFSPVFPTTSKPGHPAAGLEQLAVCCAAVPGTPVLALGGVTPERAAACRDAGAYGVAVLSGILFPAPPNDIFDAVQAYRAALDLPTLTR